MNRRQVHSALCPVISRQLLIVIGIRRYQHMLPIAKRAIKNYLKHPLFWIGFAIVILGVYQQLSPCLTIRYLSPEDQIQNNYPQTVHSAELYEGYIPTPESERRGLWEQSMRESLISDYKMSAAEADAAVNSVKKLNIADACVYFEDHYNYFGADYFYDMTAYQKGTNDELNAYLTEMLEDHPFSYYFSRRFADFAGLFMGFFATILLSVLFLQDTRKHTYELLHTKPVRAGNYVLGKVLGGFGVCLITLGILCLVFWILCLAGTKGNGFEIRLLDFIVAAFLYILPNMLAIICIYALISLLFKNPLPAAPILFLLIVYSNMGSRNAEGRFGYYGRAMAIMVRFPGTFFDTAQPPMVLFNQTFLIAASACILLLCAALWKRRRI